jgi:hypothetical protein
MIYFESQHALVEWMEADKIAFIEWRGGYVDGADYRNVLIALVELMEQKGASKLLVDTRKAKVVTPADQEWVTSVWTPRATKAGLKFTAMLVPESMVARMSLERMRTKYTTPTGGGVQYFSNADEGKKWLRSVPG